MKKQVCWTGKKDKIQLAIDKSANELFMGIITCKCKLYGLVLKVLCFYFRIHERSHTDRKIEKECRDLEKSSRGNEYW